jgi:hypothetical protein
LCDVDDNVLHDRATEFELMHGREVAVYNDFRRLLESKRIGQDKGAG